MSGGGYYGFGSKADYVRFFARRGFAIAEIARTLGTTVVKLMAECDGLDIYQYRIFTRADLNAGTAWTNDEIRKVVEFYNNNGSQWEGWRELLPNRSESAIRKCATRLGIYRR